MEDFYYAGGLPAVLEQIRDLLHLDALTVTGRTVGENLDSVPTEIIDDERDPASLEPARRRAARSSCCAATCAPTAR